MISKYTKIVAVVVAALIGTGCVNLKTAPSYARSGDFLSAGLGGAKFNTDGATTIRPSDITVTITDSGSTVHNVKVLQAFKAFPDYSSNYAINSLDRSGTFGGFYSDVEPYDGQWWVNMQLVDPLTDNPLPLATGPATVSISSALVTDTYGSDGDLTSLAVEIIGGTATPDPIDFYQYEAYAPLRAMTVQPSSLAGVTVVGGLQIKLDYNNSAIDTASGGSVVSPIKPRLVPVSHDPNINIIQHIVDNGDGTSSLIAMVTNPNGFVPDAADGGSWSIGKSTFKDLSFTIIADDDANFAGYASNYALDAAESYYIDDNGDVIGSVTPVLGLNF